ncbi:MAG: ATP-dependent DNA helicase RecG [Myxococcota bacterium]|nr:ATP-dependent DNA helicase RecG [Myxococcota bacterium]
MKTPFAAALEAVTRPLDFAAGRDFANAERIDDLERSVAAAARRAAGLAVPPDVARRLVALAERLERAAAAGEPRAGSVRRALEAVAPLREPGFADEVVARPLSSLPGVGPKRAEELARRGLRAVVDLLFHLPARYDDRRERVTVGELEVGRRATFVAEVRVADFVPGRRGRRTFQAVVGDASGTVTLKWFRGGEAVQSSVRKGARLLVSGEVRRYRFSKELIHPEIDVLGEEEDAADRAEAVVPEYTAPEGVPARTFRRLVRVALEQFADLVPATLPEDLAARRGLPETAEALRRIHAPGPDADLEALRRRDTPAHQRLVLEELYLLETGLALRRAERGAEPGIPVDVTRPALAATARALPFRLTGAQRRAWEEIRADLARPHPMARLLQGDVGSGKTAVAWLAAAAAAADGLQTALMAPTEILAEQHARTLRHLAGDAASAPRVALLTASVPRAEAETIQQALARGEVDVIVGTQALVQPDVRFARLGLVIVDEQHRFGVLQRAALAAKTPEGRVPHALVMTATPIPRSLALTLWGDLDLSVIDELPPGRSPVRTLLVREGEGAQVVELVRETLARGEQVYVVYPLVEESEKVDLRAATESTERIRAAFPAARVDLVHGRQPAPERAAAMARFGAGETRILVSTTVIEVGVDVPGATLMVVEHAERFGLAQLHQLRGRVGRGARPGTCVLVARGGGEDSEARLRAMLETTDGFRIADADLRIRGPGEFLGTRQHGRLPELRFADLVRDARLVAVAREAARRTVARDPQLRRQPGLKRAVRTRWGGRLDLAGVG